MASKIRIEGLAARASHLKADIEFALSLSEGEPYAKQLEEAVEDVDMVITRLNTVKGQVD